MASINTSMGSILGSVSAAFAIPKQPVTPFPPPLITLGAKLRTGLSARDIAARIISRQSESGAPSGDIFVGSNNVAESMEVIRIEEIINAILTESKVDVAIPPGIPTASVGTGNLGGPVVSNGATISFGVGDGIIR